MSSADRKKEPSRSISHCRAVKMATYLNLLEGIDASLMPIT